MATGLHRSERIRTAIPKSARLFEIGCPATFHKWPNEAAHRVIAFLTKEFDKRVDHCCANATTKSQDEQRKRIVLLHELSLLPCRSLRQQLSKSNFIKGFMLLLGIRMNSDLKNVILLGTSVGLGLGLFWMGYSHFYRRRKPFVGGVVASLHFYPVKSCAGIDLSEAAVGKLGVHFDRYCIVQSKS